PSLGFLALERQLPCSTGDAKAGPLPIPQARSASRRRHTLRSHQFDCVEPPTSTSHGVIHSSSYGPGQRGLPLKTFLSRSHPNVSDAMKRDERSTFNRNKNQLWQRRPD